MLNKKVDIEKVLFISVMVTVIGFVFYQGGDYPEEMVIFLKITIFGWLFYKLREERINRKVIVKHIPLYFLFLIYRPIYNVDMPLEFWFNMHIVLLIIMFTYIYRWQIRMQNKYIKWQTGKYQKLENWLKSHEEKLNSYIK